MADDPGKASAARLRKMAGPEMVRQLGAVLLSAAGDIANEAARSITTGGALGKAHVVSRPGEPPNSDTGGLDKSITAELPAPLRAEVIAAAPYAKSLEYGTSKMAARPFFKPAFERRREEVRDNIRTALAKIAKGGKVVP